MTKHDNDDYNVKLVFTLKLQNAEPNRANVSLYFAVNGRFRSVMRYDKNAAIISKVVCNKHTSRVSYVNDEIRISHFYPNGVSPPS